MAEPAETDVNPASAQSSVVYDAAPVRRVEHGESSFTRMVEHQAAKVSSDVFLVASLAAMGVSIAMELTGRDRASRFTGMWAGPLLVMGVYNKLVKVLGPR
jgi:hypothetical protein